MLAYSTGLLTAYCLNRKHTFHAEKNKKRLFMAFLLGYGGMMLNTLIVVELHHIWGIPLSKSIAIAIVFFYNYLTNKFVIFSKKPTTGHILETP